MTIRSKRGGTMEHLIAVIFIIVIVVLVVRLCIR